MCEARGAWQADLKVALIWLLLLTPPLYLQESEWSRRSYRRMRESLDVTSS